MSILAPYDTPVFFTRGGCFNVDCGESIDHDQFKFVFSFLLHVISCTLASSIYISSHWFFLLQISTWIISGVWLESYHTSMISLHHNIVTFPYLFIFLNQKSSSKTFSRFLNMISKRQCSNSFTLYLASQSQTAWGNDVAGCDGKWQKRPITEGEEGDFEHLPAPLNLQQRDQRQSNQPLFIERQGEITVLCTGGEGGLD